MSNRTRAQRSTKPQTREEPDEIALLRATHFVNLQHLKELFSHWSDVDLLYTLNDTKGDLELTISRITEGNYLHKSLRGFLSAYLPPCFLYST